ncbi:hypothetical protein MMC08_008934, partial [Hypocenomyce scalaris]|nr:hypothetical protein [Hypocenomyce scalaris]
ARIKKLVDIWERGSTFPAQMLSSFKEKLSASSSNAMQSTTPNGTPPRDFISLNEQPGTAAAPMPAPDTSAILKALADMAKSNTAAPAASGIPAQASSNNVTIPQNAFPQNMPSSVNQAPPMPQAVNIPGGANGVLSSFAGLNFPQNLSNGQPNMQTAPQPMPSQGTGPVTPESLQQQLQLLQLLQAQNVPQEQWAPLLAVLMSNGAGMAPNSNPAAQSGWAQAGGYVGGGRDDPQSRDRNGYNDQYMRSPPNRYRKPRSRSRSPTGWDRRREPSPPRRRDSPVYGEYGANGSRGDYGRGKAGARGRGNGFRQRSPAAGDRFRRSPSPYRQEHTLPPPGPKWVEYDPSIGEGMIKVLSRTLFVGGVTSSEDDLRAIFSAFGQVQTCIVNVDKRHAFVKMITRRDAMAAKDGMERYKSPEMQLRTRWGVGFGPRDCSDYQTGISIIPIERLTDADRKWMLTAEYGGSGGKSIESGLVVEEPDIEIGAGVSSKAISRRMATDKGGQQGPRSTRDTPTQGGASHFRQPEGRDRNDRDVNTIGVPPAVPGFGFQFMPNGMPMFPPGFVMPGSTPAQPPPPGAS